jgi:hypothetical protein
MYDYEYSKLYGRLKNFHFIPPCFYLFYTLAIRRPGGFMMKFMTLILLSMLSISVHAEDCASNSSQLKALVGNNGVAMNWRENTKKNPLSLSLRDGQGLMNLRLKTAEGDWANVTGVICSRGGDNYVAKVSSLAWGPAAPGIAKAAKIKEIKLKLPYPNVLKVSVSIFSFEFNPAD